MHTELPLNLFAHRLLRKLGRPDNGLLNEVERAQVDVTPWEELMASLRKHGEHGFTCVTYNAKTNKYQAQVQAMKPAELATLPQSLKQLTALSGGCHSSPEGAARAADRCVGELLHASLCKGLHACLLTGC